MEKLKAFRGYGFRDAGERSGQLYGECPFCGGLEKFHINKVNFLWDCKKCGLSGNFEQFLEQFMEHCKKNLKPDSLKALAQDRGLPPAAFEPWEFGMDGKNYIFPIRDEKGKITSLRSYRIGKKIMGTAGCPIGLFGQVGQLVKTSVNTPVYICEGEWDAMALAYLFKLNKKSGIVVAVPGASVFKKEWINFFRDRIVHLLYDNDGAGENGEHVARERLVACAKSITYMQWSSKLPQGYDVRDAVSLIAIKKKKPKKCLRILEKMFSQFPRKKPLSDLSDSVEEVQTLEPPEKKTLQEVFTVFNKWLFLKSTDAIRVALATVISNYIDGDPLWMFLVASSGGAKTEILNSLNKFEDVYETSTLTSKALISGANFVKGKDPSLIPLLNGKTLSIKDMTAILSLREQEREEIFSILRDAFDGRCSKSFGTGWPRKYVSRFTIIAAVTPKIYEFTEVHAALGERFLKFCIGDNLEHDGQVDSILKAMDNVNQETTMRTEISEITAGFLYHKAQEVKRLAGSVVVPPYIKLALVACTRFISMMRAQVPRDRFRPDNIVNRPSSEVGTRVAKQLIKLVMSLALLEGRTTVNAEDYNIARKVVKDTISQKTEDLVRIIYENCPTEDDSIKTREISEKTAYNMHTVSRALQDMHLCGILEKKGPSNSHEWSLTKKARKIIEEAKLYRAQLPQEIPSNHQPIRVKKRLIPKRPGVVLVPKP